MALPALFVLRTGWSTRVVSEKFLVSYFPFCKFPTTISSTFFLKFKIYQVILEVLLHFQCFETSKWWLYYRLNAFNFTGMIFYNQSSLVVLRGGLEQLFDSHCFIVFGSCLIIFAGWFHFIFIYVILLSGLWCGLKVSSMRLKVTSR